MSGGTLGLDREPWRWVLQFDPEDGVGPCVCVLNLHIEVGEGRAVGDILRYRDFVLLLVEGGRLIVDVSDCDRDVGQ